MKVSSKKTVLVVVAHSDDETLGMGGAIRRHVIQGDDVLVVSMTDGVSSREKSASEALISRHKSALLASDVLGFKWEECFQFPDNAMDSCPLLEIVKSVEKTKLRVCPDIVYTHSVADLNVDHKVVANAVLTAFRPHHNEKCGEIRLFEIPSATDFGHKNLTGAFEPNLFVEISDEWATKEAALNAYKAEMRNYPNSRSVKGVKNLAKLRGNQVGLFMAEAFQVIRKIER